MDKLRLYGSEMLGTFVLVFVGVGSIGAAKAAHAPPGVDLLAVALAFGSAVAVVVAAMGHVSGAHINPAVTFALLVTNKIKIGDGLAYIASQLVGAVLATALCQGLMGTSVAAGAATSVSPHISLMQGLGMEIVSTFFLVLVIFGTAVDMRAQKLPALFIGLTVTLDILVAGPYTGASMNPARSFGPALIGGVWSGHWVYWVGPLAGGSLAAIVYAAVFLPREPAEAMPEVRPEAAASSTQN
jgi:MIP family channel proteins